MILACPFCGPRNLGEFAYRGDAAPKRPGAGASEEEFADYVYLRDNPASPMREHWQHAQGCRAWLVVTRDTRNHAILAVEAAPGAREAALSA